jgi:hypothetical protein
MASWRATLEWALVAASLVRLRTVGGFAPENRAWRRQADRGLRDKFSTKVKWKETRGMIQPVGPGCDIV